MIRGIHIWKAKFFESGDLKLEANTRAVEM